MVSLWFYLCLLGRTQYPLIVPPHGSSSNHTTAAPTTGKKKIIPSYTDHNIQSNASQVASTPPPVVTRPPAPVNNTPAFGKALKPVTKTLSPPPPSLPKAPSEKPSAARPAAAVNPLPSIPSETGSSSAAPADTAGLTVKQRMALLNSKGDSGLPIQPDVAKKSTNLMEQMMSRQSDRKNLNSGPKVSSLGQNVMGVASKPLAVPAPRAYIKGDAF